MDISLFKIVVEILLYRLFASEVEMIGPADNLKPAPYLLDYFLQGTQGAELIPVAADDESASPREVRKVELHEVDGGRNHDDVGEAVIPGKGPRHDPCPKE